jgi:hypothetical protein
MGGLTRPAFPFNEGKPSVAFGLHPEDRGVVNEGVNYDEGHRLVQEDPVPFSVRLI